MKNKSEPTETLNEAQRKAVTFGAGPLLIIAGAGTGKTKVITHRIAHLVTSKLARPEQILAVTFTEKAANEMEERVDLLIPYSYSYAEISTFNSFGERVLRNYGHELGFPPDFQLLDEVDQALFFRQRLFEFPLNYYRPLSSPARFIQDLLAAIKRLKQEDVDPEDFEALAGRELAEARDEVEAEIARKHGEIAGIYGKYRELLKHEGKIDFEDQVGLTVELFRSRPSVLDEFQKKFKYILVDEFQDTNFMQFELLKLLAAGHNNLTVVGDDDQSIFRFRGASLSNIQNFRSIYPEAEKIVLTTNYRSTQDILDSSYTLIQHNNPDRLEVRENIDKRLTSTLTGRGKSIHMLQMDTLSHEADKAAEIIAELSDGGTRFTEIAILVRRNADADPFLRALNMKDIPFRFSGSRGLYALDEIKILTAFIRAVTDFEDSASLFFLSLSEVYGLDPYELSRLAVYAQKKNISLHQVFRMVDRGSSPVDLSEEIQRLVRRIFEDLLGFVRLSGSQNAGRVLYEFLVKSGFLKMLIESDPQAEVKIKNIRIFFDKVRDFSRLGEDDSLRSFAEHLNLLLQVGDNPASAEADLEEDAVQVLTVHKAKGLEFPVVFMVSLIADRFPGRMRRERIHLPDALFKEDLPAADNTLQEERRLFYVGMTRAKTTLYLTWARDYGLKRLKKVSPFVLEALDLSRAPDAILRSSALEEIESYAPAGRKARPQKVHERAPSSISLSYFQVDDYLTCPLRYKFRHIWRIPVLPHHNLVFGRVLHVVIHRYLQNRMRGEKMDEAALLGLYEKSWINEGYLSREHEDMRKAAGARALKLFFRREDGSGRRPTLLEEAFRWQDGDIRFNGRFDRVDFEPDGAVIIDYKSSEVRDQREADKRARDSLQMDLYALSLTRIRREKLKEVRLHFLESDIIGSAEKGKREFSLALDRVREVHHGIIKGDFKAKPDWHSCHNCDFRGICPDSYAY